MHAAPSVPSEALSPRGRATLVWDGSSEGAHDGCGSHTPGGQLGLAVLGLTAGFASGFLGVGGGLIIIPALVIGFRTPMKRAVGVSLLAVVAVSTIGVLAEMVYRQSNIHWEMGFLLTVGSLVGSLAGGKILYRLPERPLRLLLAVIMLCAACRMLGSAQAGGAPPLIPLTGSATGFLFTAAVGALAGFTSVLFGIGGGLVMVPAFSLFSDLPFHVVRATSLVTIVPTSGLGAYQHHDRGTLDVSAALRLIPTGLAGAVLGVVSVNLLPAAPCRLAFAAVLLFAAAHLLLLKR